MEYLKNKILNKSEIARQIGITPDIFRQKLYKRHFNKFTPEQIEKIKIRLLCFANDILNEVGSIKCKIVIVFDGKSYLILSPINVLPEYEIINILDDIDEALEQAELLNKENNS